MSGQELTGTPPTVADLVHAFHARGDAPAVTELVPGRPERKSSYRDLAQAIEAAAGRLTDCGVEPGDRVVLACHNSTAMVVAALAVMSAGAIVVPMDCREDLPTTRWAVERVRASLLVVDDDARETARAVAAATGAATIAVTSLADTATCEVTSPGDTATCEVTSPATTAEQSTPVRAPIGPDTPAVILFSSGSTARPKGIVLSHGNLLDNARALRVVHDIRPDDRHLCVLPLFHANAFGFSMVAVLSAGAHLLLMPGFDPLAFSDAVRAHRPTVASLVPQLLRALSARRGLLRGSSLRYVVSAAAPLARRTVQDFAAATGLRVHQGYGLSECTNFATAIRVDHSDTQYQQAVLEAEPPSIGSALPGCEVAVLRDGALVPDGVHGEIVVRGRHVMLRYWDDVEATAATLVNGWLRTGDEGFARTIEGERFFFLTGRRKEMAIRLGTKISPAAVDRELGERGAVGDFAAVAFRHAATGEEIGVYLARSSADALDRLVAAIRDVPFERSPKVVVIGAEPVPRTSTGKVRRRDMAGYFDAYQEAPLRAANCPVVEKHS